MTLGGEPIPVSEPGELLPEGTSFLDAFGASLSDVDINRLRVNLDSISENERRATEISQNIIIGKSLAQPIRYPGKLIAKGVPSRCPTDEDVQNEFEVGLSEIDLAEQAAEADLNTVLGDEDSDNTTDPHSLSPKALGILNALLAAHRERELQRAGRPQARSSYILVPKKIRKHRSSID